MKCPSCRRPLIEIDLHGERLVGCTKCNRWGRIGTDRLLMQLPDDDLQALTDLSDARHAAEDTTPSDKP
jgi:hypothetical protein